MSNYRIIYSDELCHYGVLGMKWGVRRYQNPDGSLTKAGRRRYDDVAQNPTSHLKPKSKHRQALEKKYKEQGMTSKEASEAAAKRIKTEKIIAAAAGITLAAATAYVVSKNIRSRTDHIIKSGKTLQRIQKEESVNFDNALYTSRSKMDNLKYRGEYGNQLRYFTSETPRQIKLKTVEDIKVVSDKKARDSFVDLYKNNKEFKKLYDDQVREVQLFTKSVPDARYKKLYSKLDTHMSDKVLRNNGYDSFNRQLASHNERDSKLNKMFYEKLKSQGYDAVEDLNDRKYSGYKSKTSTIVFNPKGKLAVDVVKKMTDEEINSDYAKTKAINLSPQLAKAGAIYIGSPVVANKTVKTIRINNYKNMHPGTTMTDSEIWKTIKGKKK